MQSVSALARERNVTIYNEVDAEMVVAGFEAYIESIILNMLTNAIKYSDTAKESFVRIYGGKEQAYCKICFEDNGIGMNLQVVGERLFGM
ncbi:MAG: ATP-binding protein [Chitinophagaceae bacterium]